MSAYGEFANNEGYIMKYPLGNDDEAHKLYIFNNTPAQLGDSATKGVNINGGDHVTVEYLNRPVGSTFTNLRYPDDIKSYLFTNGTVRTTIVQGNKVDATYTFGGYEKVISDLGIMSEVSNVCRRILQTTIANGGATLASAIDALSKLQGDRNQPLEKADTTIRYTRWNGNIISLQDIITGEGNAFVGTLTNDRILLALIILIRQVAYLTVTIGDITWLLSFIPDELMGNIVVQPLTAEEVSAAEAKYIEQFAKIQSLKMRKEELLTELDDIIRSTITGYDAFDHFETIIYNIFNYINNSRFINNLDSLDDLQSDLDFSISKIRSPDTSNNNNKRVQYNKIIGSDNLYRDYYNNLVVRDFSNINIIEGIQYLKFIAKHRTFDEFNRDNTLKTYKNILHTIRPNEKGKLRSLLSGFRIPDIDTKVNGIKLIVNETDRQFSARKENSKKNYTNIYEIFIKTFNIPRDNMQGGGQEIENYIVEVFSNEKNEIQKRLSFFLKLKEFLNKGNGAFRKFLLETKHTYSLNQKKDIVKFVLGEKCDYDESILNDMLKDSTKKSIFSPKELARKDVNTRIDYTEKRGEFLDEIRSIALLLNRDAIFQTADFPVTSISDEQGRAWHLSPVEDSNKNNFLQHYIAVDTDEPSTDPDVKKEQTLNRYIDYTERADIYKLQKEDLEDDEYYEGLVKAAKEAAEEYNGSDKKEIDIHKHIFSSPLDLKEFYDTDSVENIIDNFNIYKDYDSGGYFKGEDPEFTWDERMKIIGEEDKKVPSFTRKARNNKGESNANRRREAARAYANKTRKLAKAARFRPAPAVAAAPAAVAAPAADVPGDAAPAAVPGDAAPVAVVPDNAAAQLAKINKFSSVTSTPIRASQPTSGVATSLFRSPGGEIVSDPASVQESRQPSAFTSPVKGKSRIVSKDGSKDGSKLASTNETNESGNGSNNSSINGEFKVEYPLLRRIRGFTENNLSRAVSTSPAPPAALQLSARRIGDLERAIESLRAIPYKTEQQEAELQRLRDDRDDLFNRTSGGRRRTKRKGNAKRTKRTTRKR
jgi:hypothetical protein